MQITGSYLNPPETMRITEFPDQNASPTPTNQQSNQAHLDQFVI
jgi:hypothetical protein